MENSEEQLAELIRKYEEKIEECNTQLIKIKDTQTGLSEILTGTGRTKEGIETVAAKINETAKSTGEVKDQIDGFHRMVKEALVNSNNTKTQIDAVLSSANDVLVNANKTKEQIDSTLVNSNNAVAASVKAKEQIDGVLASSNSTLANSNKSKEQLDGVLVSANEVLVTSNKTKDQITAALTSSNEVLAGAKATKGEIDKVLEQSSKSVDDLIEFYNDVFKDQKDANGDSIKQSLKTFIDASKEELRKLTVEATNQLYSLTDSSLHNTFAVRASAYTIEFKELETITFKLTLAVVADILIFGLIELGLILFGDGFDYHILIYQFSIAGALVFAIWMYNRNQKIAKKLAEFYHHKASLAEAMTGYRKLYNLGHESNEYMELFNAMKDQLNTNPASGIDELLNLKSPHEELTSAVKDLLNPANLKELLKETKGQV